MSTGLVTWQQNLNDLEIIYPFAGTEMILFVVGFSCWIIWHLLQIKMENKFMAEEDAVYQDKAKLNAARTLANAESISEVAKAHADGY
jgi:hypothetical protein